MICTFQQSLKKPAALPLLFLERGWLESPAVAVAGTQPEPDQSAPLERQGGGGHPRDHDLLSAPHVHGREIVKSRANPWSRGPPRR